MLPLHMSKGTPRLLLSLPTAGAVLDLMIYPDGSHSIFRDGKHLAVWEPGEELDCLRTLARMADPSVKASVDETLRILSKLRIHTGSEPLWN